MVPSEASHRLADLSPVSSGSRARILALLRLTLLAALSSGWASFASVAGEKAPARPESKQEQQEPVKTELVEQVETRLILVEVEVVDRKKRPVRGLRLEDFSLQVDTEDYPIRTMDDMCACAEEPRRSSTPTAPPRSTAEGAEEAPLPAPLTRTILLFDLPHLSPPSTVRALAAARTWLASTPDEDLLVDVVVHAPVGVFDYLARSSRKRAAIEEALARIEGPPLLASEYAMLATRRIENCIRCQSTVCLDDPFRCLPPEVCTTRCCTDDCLGNARRERAQLESSHRAFEEFLASYEERRESRNLVLFHDARTLVPGKFFGVPEQYVGYLHRDAERLYGAATTKRTRVISAYSGPFTAPRRSWAQNFGANIADGTGGDYNRSPGDLDDLFERIGERCCVYLIGIEVPRSDKAPRVRQLRFRVKGKRHRRLYRVVF